jgi:hypothetical protein
MIFLFTTLDKYFVECKVPNKHYSTPASKVPLLTKKLSPASANPQIRQRVQSISDGCCELHRVQFLPFEAYVGVEGFVRMG